MEPKAWVILSYQSSQAPSNPPHRAPVSSQFRIQSNLHLGVQLRLELHILGCHALQADQQVALLLRERQLLLLNLLRISTTDAVTTQSNTGKQSVSVTQLAEFGTQPQVCTCLRSTGK